MSNRKMRTRRVSVRQLEILWEFLNSNRDIAIAYNRSLHAKEYSKRKWIQISEILNAQDNGVHKEWKEWSKYWVDYKAKLKKKASVLRSAENTNGGVPSREQPLPEIDIKYMQILGEDFGQGLPRVEPFQGVQVVTVPHDQVESSANIILEHIESGRFELIPENQTTATIKESLVSEPILLNTSPNSSPGVSPPPASPASPAPPAHPAHPASPAPPAPPASTVRSSRPWRRHRRRDLAKRSLVESCIRRAEATVRIGDALVGIQRTLERIESLLSGAVSRAGQ